MPATHSTACLTGFYCRGCYWPGTSTHGPGVMWGAGDFSRPPPLTLEFHYSSPLVVGSPPLSVGAGKTKAGVQECGTRQAPKSFAARGVARGLRGLAAAG